MRESLHIIFNRILPAGVVLVDVPAPAADTVGAVVVDTAGAAGRDASFLKLVKPDSGAGNEE